MTDFLGLYANAIATQLTVKFSSALNDSGPWVTISKPTQFIDSYTTFLISRRERLIAFNEITVKCRSCDFSWTSTNCGNETIRERFIIIKRS